MHRMLVGCLLLGLAGCGPAASTTPPAPVPVKSTPLAGTVNGQPWAPVSATASARKAFSEDGGEKWIDLGATHFTCNDFVPEAEVIGTIPWQTGAAYDLSLSHNLTIITHKPDGGGIVNNIAISGRVEVISAPDAGVGTIRIRANASSDNAVEGQIDVTVCD
jgi:hypothetical protein